MDNITIGINSNPYGKRCDIMAILTFKQRREICSLVMDYVDEYPNIYLDGAEYVMNNQEAYNDARILLLDILDVVATNVHNNNRR